MGLYSKSGIDKDEICLKCLHKQSVSDLFVSRGGPVGQTTVVKHAILTEGPPIRQQMRRVPETLKSVVDSEVTKMLEQGVAKPRSNPWSSPIVMIWKKDGSWRFCIDYRKLNSITHHDDYPLPRIDSILVPSRVPPTSPPLTLPLAIGRWKLKSKIRKRQLSPLRRVTLNSMLCHLVSLMHLSHSND